MFELNLRQVLPKTVSRCQGNCRKKITENDGMFIKSYRTTRWTDKKTGKETSKWGPMYKNFNKTYKLKNTTGQTKDSITLPDKIRNLLDEEKDFLTAIGIKYSHRPD